MVDGDEPFEDLGEAVLDVVDLVFGGGDLVVGLDASFDGEDEASEAYAERHGGGVGVGWEEG